MNLNFDCIVLKENQLVRESRKMSFIDAPEDLKTYHSFYMNSIDWLQSQGSAGLLNILKNIPIKSNYYWEEVYPDYDTPWGKTFFHSFNFKVTTGYSYENEYTETTEHYEKDLLLKDKIEQINSSTLFTVKEWELIASDHYTTFLNKLISAKVSCEKDIEFRLFKKLLEDKNIAFVNDKGHQNRFYTIFKYGDLSFSKFNSGYNEYAPKIALNLTGIEGLYIIDNDWWPHLNVIKNYHIKDLFIIEQPNNPKNISISFINTYLINPKEFICRLINDQIALMDIASNRGFEILKRISGIEIPKNEALMQSIYKKLDDEKGEKEQKDLLQELRRIKEQLESYNHPDPYVSITSFSNSIRGCEKQLALFMEHKRKLIELQMKYV